MIQIRNVPDELHRELKWRAALVGMSHSDYLLSEIGRVAERPTSDALRARLATRSAVIPSFARRRRPVGARSASIVVDASAAKELLLQTRAAAAIEAALFAPDESLHAPHLIDIEVTQVIRRYAAMGEIDDARGRVALDDLRDLPMARYPHDILLPRVWELRSNLTAYDAAYVALAEALDAVLITRDKRLAGAAGHRARIMLV